MQLVPMFLKHLPARHMANRLARHMALSLSLALPLGALPVTTPPAAAQGLFSPAIKVNEDVITWFELEQRAQFMRLLRAPGNPEELAREELIKDRLRRQAIRQAGIVIPPEDVQLGIEEFASRTEMPAEEFLKVLEDNGVSPETVRDFVEVGIAWREYVAARFLAQARPTDAEIDRALSRVGAGGGVRVLLSEVILPLTPQNLVEVEALAEQIAEIDSFEAFSQAATQYSASDTRQNGGRMDWIAINNLPPALRPVILALNPGDVTSPLGLPNAIALFQMRDIQETGAAAVRYSGIEYAQYFIAGGRSPEALATAARLRDTIDTCDDLYGVALGQSPGVLQRVTQAPGEIPRDIALELAKLDEDEVSTALTRNNGQTLVFLMLCGRSADLGEEASREDVANALTQQRLQSFAESHLSQLHADALIVEK